MTEPTRGTRARRGNRRPGSLLLTTLLVLAIVASSALVFTNRVELLKLAVIVALWAAVVAAFVSFIYRRQADIDQAKSRDLKLVYDLQLDREISARREYELSIETQLRRELASELRAQSADEVASLRAELAALRANLEIIFDTDLQSRPAIENERTTVHRFGNWDAAGEGAPPIEPDAAPVAPGRVISSRIDAEAEDDSDPTTEESPIIDVPAEPQPPDEDWSPQVPVGAHRRPSERGPVDTPWRPPPPQEAPRREDWQPAPAEGRFIPAGAPGSNWASPPAPVENRDEPPPAPAMTPPPTEPPRPGRHYVADVSAAEAARRARHSAPADADPGRRTAPTLAPSPPPPPDAAPESPAARHRGGADEADDADGPAGQHIGGQPVSELMARLQVGSTGGGRRRRREE